MRGVGARKLAEKRRPKTDDSNKECDRKIKVRLE
jgi:hypothetical protein